MAERSAWSMVVQPMRGGIGAAAAYAAALSALVFVVVLRYWLDRWLGDALPLVTLYGAVAAASWAGGYRPAALVSILGYLACSYLFIEPRGQLGVFQGPQLIGFVAYLVTCAFIIGFGEAARRAQLFAGGRRDEAQLLASIIESSDDAIIRKNLDGVIESWNRGAERLFGHAAAEAVGRHISLVIPPERLDEEAHIIASLKAGRRIDHFETERMHADGRRLLVSLTISPVKDDSGRVVGASKIVRDVTRQRQAEQRERQLLSDADRRKNEFLAMLAHELRNPLASISYAARVLRLEGASGDARRSASEALERQIGQMTRLVDDLLDSSRITRGRIDLRRQPVELAPIVQQAVESIRVLTASRGQELTVSVPSESIALHADPARLAQVIGNLLNNASKFTDPGGRLELTVERQGHEAVVRVTDTGIGISPDDVPRIFDMFVQVDTSLERSRDGLGIGLTLVKMLVELHGGSVQAESDGPGRGSRFTVRLPVSVAAVSAPPGADDPPPTVRRRVLIVDDSVDGAESLAILLQLAGHETHQAHDGLAAIDAARRLRPDAMLLDIGLPRLNGYEVCRQIRKEPWGTALLLVALTGWGQDEDRRRSAEAGFDAHLVKPVDPDTLLSLLASASRDRHASRVS